MKNKHDYVTAAWDESNNDDCVNKVAAYYKRD